MCTKLLPAVFTAVYSLGISLPVYSVELTDVSSQLTPESETSVVHEQSANSLSREENIIIPATLKVKIGATTRVIKTILTNSNIPSKVSFSESLSPFDLPELKMITSLEVVFSAVPSERGLYHADFEYIEKTPNTSPPVGIDVSLSEISRIQTGNTIFRFSPTSKETCFHSVVEPISDSKKVLDSLCLLPENI